MRPRRRHASWWNSANGDKFLFDIGSGSAERISSLQIPYNYLDKVFIGHLHTDHFGSLHDLFIGGALMGRNVPLRVWGPSGAVPELGTRYALDHMLKMLTWDMAGRRGNVDPRGYRMEVQEFDYKGVNQVVYEANGVTIRSFPAIHAIDGSVSYSLEWNGLKFVFSSDTYPNKWFVEYAKDADLSRSTSASSRCPTSSIKMGFTPESALVGGNPGAHRTRGVRQGDERRRAAHGRRLSLLQGLRHHGQRSTIGSARPTTGRSAWPRTSWSGTSPRTTSACALAEVDHHTWAPPLASSGKTAVKLDDRRAFAKKSSASIADDIGFGDFTKSAASGTWTTSCVRSTKKPREPWVGSCRTQATRRRSSAGRASRPWASRPW